MKQLSYCVLAILTILAAWTLQACNDDDNDYPINRPNALVTIKTNSSTGQIYLQLDDETTLFPTNMKTSTYGNKELRALANLNIQRDPNGHYAKNTYVNWIDTIRTKNMVPSVGTKDDEVYGKDPVEIVKDWTTVVEDGYLTLRFRTYYGSYYGYGPKHSIDLVKGSGPYEVVLHHNAKGDTGKGYIRDGLVAFRLKDLPDTQGKTVDLTLKWQSFSGTKTVTFKYKSRQQ